MTSEPIQILVVDDHAVVRKGLVMVLRLEPDFHVVGEAGDGEYALELAARHRPDLIVLDRMIPGVDCRSLVVAIRSASPQSRLLVLTGTEIDAEVLDLLEAGVDGYVLKDVEPEELKTAIRTVAGGEAYLHPAVTRQVLNRMRRRERAQDTAGLTARELEVLQWLATPHTYREIAERLYVSEETIRSHVKSIFAKLSQRSRAQAVLAAIRLGLIDSPEG